MTLINKKGLTHRIKVSRFRNMTPRIDTLDDNFYITNKPMDSILKQLGV